MLRPYPVALVVLAAACCLPAHALAWTSAKVRDVRAEIDVDARGSAQVTLDIGVEVLGGWLERFDLDGLDEELALPEAEAAWLTTDEGVVVPASAESDGGAITLHFDKQRAARRGLHRVGVRYAAPLRLHASPTDGSVVQLDWLLPGWEHGLSRAEIVVRGPKGLAAVRDPEQAVELTQSLIKGQSVLTFVRVLVPRSTAWSIAAEGPERLFVRQDIISSARTGQVSVREVPLSVGAGMAGLVWLVGLLSRAAFRRRARALKASTRGWIESDLTRRSLSVLLTLCAVWGASHSSPVMVVALLALASCFVDRVELVAPSSPFGRFTALGTAPQGKARASLRRERLGSMPVADIATVLGFVGASSLLIVAVYRVPTDLTVSLGLMCALPLWVASSRLRLPRSTDEQLALLMRAAKHALALSCGMRLVGFVVGDGEVCSPRIRIVTATRFSGLLRIDVAVDTRRSAPALVLVAVTQTGSLADRALTETLGTKGRELSPRGNRAAYIEPIDELGATLERVLTTLAASGQRSIERSEAQRAA